MISYRFVPISSQKGVLFFETPGRRVSLIIRLKSMMVSLYVKKLCPQIKIFHHKSPQ